MADKNDSAPGDAARAGSAGGGQGAGSSTRPHATLDLKATEIKDQTPASPAAKSGAPSPVHGTAENSGPASALAHKAAEAGHKGQSQPRLPTGVSRASGGARASGAGLVLTHFLAGLAGGALVLAGGYELGSERPAASLDAEASGQQVAAIEERLQALEGAPRWAGADAAFTQKVSEAEGRLAELEEMGRTLKALSDAHGRLESETKALAEKFGREREGGADQERMAKLEERLDMLAAAGTGSSSGLPQLAAMTAKITDLESSVADQLALLRKAMTSEIDGRLAQVTEANEAAQAATTRLEREFSALRSETARLTQRLDASQADSSRLTAELGALQRSSDSVAAAVAELSHAVENAAKPADIAATITPVAGKLEALEKTVQSVVTTEADRKTSAERIVLALELSNLKRLIDLGQPYAAELVALRKAARGRIDLSALDRYGNDGVSAFADLEREFREVMHAVLDADSEPTSGSVMDRLFAGAKGFVRVRKVNHGSGDTSTEAVVARIEAALKERRMADVIEESKAISAKAAVPMQDWLDKIRARHAADEAIATIERELKASLGGPPGTPAGGDPAPAVMDRNGGPGGQ